MYIRAQYPPDSDPIPFLSIKNACDYLISLPPEPHLMALFRRNDRLPFMAIWMKDGKPKSLLFSKYE